MSREDAERLVDDLLQAFLDYENEKRNNVRKYLRPDYDKAKDAVISALSLQERRWEMSDIVERLRAEVDCDVNEPLDRLLDEAADEIDQLRKALGDFVKAYEMQDADNFTDELREAYATASTLSLQEGGKPT